MTLKHGLDSEGLTGSINSAKPFQAQSEEEDVRLSSPCNAVVSAVTRPVIIHRFGGGGGGGRVKSQNECFADDTLLC